MNVQSEFVAYTTITVLCSPHMFIHARSQIKKITILGANHSESNWILYMPGRSQWTPQVRWVSRPSMYNIIWSIYVYVFECIWMFPHHAFRIRKSIRLALSINRCASASAIGTNANSSTIENKLVSPCFLPEILSLHSPRLCRTDKDDACWLE